ncbi:Lipase member M [Varanus komodoensis]|uniref:lipase member M-like n=1 Tax=Varanus komodoensis TaxID=61221 RepID=UPI001CF7D83F|nr:lipase member M-like [Varanus komodoensis]KAF7247261.1 Lipase member M [Varanus komodoensis]
MLLLIMMSLLVLGPTGSEQSSRNKREVDPEAFMNISEVIEHEDYPNEEYEILTDDGYYLVINRIPHGRKTSENTGAKPVALVMPGILTNGGIWVTNLPNNSLGFILADAGFDVWLANNRGNRWCTRHHNFSRNQEEFWNFSFHEMGMNDVPAIINFVLAKTMQKQIYYIGYSQGSTLGFIAFSAMPQLAQKIKVFFIFGPIHLLKHTKSLYPKLAVFSDAFAKSVLGKKEFCVLPNNATRAFTAKLCNKNVWNKVCAKLIFSAGGISKNNVNMSRLDVMATHLLDCTSVKNILHWAQVAQSGEFKAFDYGSKNMKNYNQVSPPFYNIKDMNVPTVVWSGGKDIMATPEDTTEVLSLLGNLIYHKEIRHWMHYDFVFGLDARQEVYDELVEIMQYFP